MTQDPKMRRDEVPEGIGAFLRWTFARIVSRKRWWLLPLWIVLVLVGFLILLSGGSSLLPVIYIAF